MQIDPKYKISPAGEYNAGVGDCLECGVTLRPLHSYALGVADSPIGTILIIQCPHCFAKWHFHIREIKSGGHYDLFARFIENDMNHWLNPDMSEKI